MPSRKYQQGYIFRGKKGTKKRNSFVLVMKKTGFHDVWIGDKHFYYDETVQYDSPDEIDMVSAFQPAPKSTAKKGKIVVKKKK